MTKAAILSLILILTACQLQEESKNPPMFTGNNGFFTLIQFHTGKHWRVFGFFL